MGIEPLKFYHHPKKQPGPHRGRIRRACCNELCAVASTVKPEAELVAKYEARYQQFQKIYPAVKNLFPEIQ